jgi:hypothetical protein
VTVNKISKREIRWREEQRQHEEMLSRWFTLSGKTMEDFIADVERLQPDDKADPAYNAANRLGISPEIIAPVFEYPDLCEWDKLLIARAMQNMAIIRPWRRKAEKEAAPDLTELPLFARIKRR